jgi:hypothetical protein
VDRSGVVDSMVVDWGDGSRAYPPGVPAPDAVSCVATSDSHSLTHDYYSAGTFTVKVFATYHDCAGTHHGTASDVVTVTVS